MPTLGPVASDDHIVLGHGECTVHTRSNPFARGVNRQAHYARTAASNSQPVVKSSITDCHSRRHMIEDTRCQTLCKTFALEFSGLLKIEPPLDLEDKSGAAAGTPTKCMSLEPFVQGEYVKYSSKCRYVNEELADERFNLLAQAFSHFTFQRSWGLFLVNDLRCVGHLLTGPSVQTRDPDRFKLGHTNLGPEGFECFLATHAYNRFYRQLDLRSDGQMFRTGKWSFRETWPPMASTACCSNRLCRRIIRLEKARADRERFPGHNWCDECWAQLDFSVCKAVCEEPGPVQGFEVSRFFHESRGEPTPRRCLDHRAKKLSASGAAAIGGGLFRRGRARPSAGPISGKA